MMTRIIFTMGLLISYCVEATSSMNGVTKTGKDAEPKVYCNDSDSINYQCELILGDNYHNILSIKDNNECGSFNITPVSKDKIIVECGFNGISNIYIYEMINSNLLLTRYEYYYSGSSSESDDFIVNKDNLLALNRDVSDDIGIDGNKMVSVGYINKKSYLYDKNYNKTKMYLVNGDKVLILGVKKYNKDNKFFEILFLGKRVVKGWINSSDVSYLGVNSMYLMK